MLFSYLGNLTCEIREKPSYLFLALFISDDYSNWQFLNKLRYAKEGARDIMDRACADLPWQVWLEVDGRDIEIPKVNYL